MQYRWKTIVTSLMAMTLFACSQAQDEVAGSGYEAQVKVTQYGISHITADSYANLGFGEGYMAARDHVCNISYGVMKAGGELSKYLGSGSDNSYLIQDTVSKALHIPQKSSAAYDLQPVDVQDMYRGYAAGFNKYLKEQENTSWCKSQQWVVPVTARDLFNRSQYIIHSLTGMSAAIYAASPPLGEISQTQPQSEVSELLILAAEKAAHKEGFGSNAWAYGKDLSENGRGMLLANPHYPWFGTNRFWEKHLTIPGQLDAYGVHLVGIPGLVIGFNNDIGYSATVSASQRLVLYKLNLVEGDPTSYLFDGEIRKMTSQEVKVAVKSVDGVENIETRKIWFSHHGPLIKMAGLGWDSETAYAVRDANGENIGAYAQWYEMARAGSMDEFKGAHQKWNAMPWINTIATSKEGEAVYLDNSNVGNISAEAFELWQDQYENDAVTKKLRDQYRLFLLDGSDSRFDWIEDGTSPTRGTVSYEQKPQITRSDYVFNSNDNYWLSNPHQPLKGYSKLYGETETARSLRSRMNIIHLEDEAARGADGKLSLQEIQQNILSNKSLAFDVYKDGIMRVCRANGMASHDDVEIPIADACSILSDYDGNFNIESRGAPLFREWLQAYDFLTRDDKPSRFATEFSVDNPYMSPSGLGSEASALQALAMAKISLQQNGWDIESTLGEMQFAYRGSTLVPMHGGRGAEGIANMIDSRINDTTSPMEQGQRNNSWSNLTDKGYLVQYGSSFIMTLEYLQNGPRAQAFLTYGQSGNPQSEHYKDQTQLFSQKKWRDIYFNNDDIEQNAVETIILSSKP